MGATFPRRCLGLRDVAPLALGDGLPRPKLAPEFGDGVESVLTGLRNWLARELNFKIHAIITFPIQKPAFPVKIRFTDVENGKRSVS